jgi:hypothetical protein
MKTAFLAACFLTATALNAQNYEWANSFRGGPTASSLDASGNIYTIGVFSGTVDFDPGAGSADLTAAGGSDVFVQKMDANGNFLWAKAFGGASDDFGASVAVDASGNVYSTGFFLGTADFDPGTGTADLTSAGIDDVFVQKMDASGAFVWAKAFGGADLDRGSSIAVDASGNVYTTGTFQGTADFDPGSAIVAFTSAGFGDIFVQKLDASGNLLWAKAFGGAASDGGNAIWADASGDVYTTGVFQGTADFDPGSGTANLTFEGFFDAFVQKMDASGNFLWAKAFGGPGGDEGLSIKTDAAGNVYTLGNFGDTADFDPGVGTTNLASEGIFDYYVQKLDASGNFLWATSCGGSDFDYGLSIALDASGNVYATGLFQGTVDFDPGAGVASLTAAGQADVFIQKLDAAGNLQWVSAIGGPDTDEGESIAVDASGNVYAIGRFSGTVDFDPNAGTAELTSAVGSTDVFVLKLSQDGISGMDEVVEGFHLTASPNPSQGLVQLSFDRVLRDVEITITDVQGKVVFSKQPNAVSNEQIRIDGPSGIYFLRAKSATHQRMVKLIVE